MLPHLFNQDDLIDTVAFVIFLGANDGSRLPSRSHVPLDEYQQNLEEMVTYLVVCDLNIDKLIS